MQDGKTDIVLNDIQNLKDTENLLYFLISVLERNIPKVCRSRVTPDVIE